MEPHPPTESNNNNYYNNNSQTNTESKTFNDSDEFDDESLLCREDMNACLSSDEDHHSHQIFNLNNHRSFASNNKDEDGDSWQFLDGNASSSATTTTTTNTTTTSSSPFISDLYSSVSALMSREQSYMPNADFLLKIRTNKLSFDSNIRLRAISWLFKTRDSFKFSLQTGALSVNYLDRFVSQNQLPLEKEWLLQLLSVACLSLAAKMEEIEVPLLMDLQAGADIQFEPRIIQRMELLVLSTLGWRMNSITAFSYTVFFISRLDPPTNTKQVLISRTNELIVFAIQEIRFLHYLPSSIAAAATLFSVQEVLPQQFAQQKRALLCTMIPDSQSELITCYALMLELFNPHCDVVHAGDLFSTPQSPMGVLDASFSSTSINYHATTRSIASPQSSRKRRLDVLF